MRATRTLLFFRLCAVLLVVTIGLQAVEPIRAPLQRVTGSAFSASTTDVALIASRRATDIAAPVPITPPLPGRVSPTSLAMIAAILPGVYVRPHARGPPPRRTSERLPDLRGPPLS